MIGPPEQALPGLPGLLDITLSEVSPDRAEVTLTVGPEHLAPTGYLHAATVVVAGRHRLRVRLPSS
jgi:acyl-coenzyme A thioesterase PaaI-like protein